MAENSSFASESHFLHREALLLGEEAVKNIAEARVILFGVGGVGSWCAEALVRSGVQHLTMVDFDLVAPSNINRQLPATAATVGKQKVDVMRLRLLEINPNADIVAISKPYNEQTAAEFHLNEYDVVIDAIDSLADKANLILEVAGYKNVLLVSSMGAARKFDPSKIAVAEFWSVTGCPLARALRNNFKKTGRFPRRKFKCVYSTELLDNQDLGGEGAEAPAGKRPNGTVAHITGIFGLTLASLVISHFTKA